MALNKLGALLREAQVLEEAAKGLRDGTCVTIQTAPVEGEVVTADHALLGVQVWRPQGLELGPIVELAAHRSWTFAELKEMLEGWSGIPAEHMRISASPPATRAPPLLSARAQPSPGRGKLLTCATSPGWSGTSPS